MLEIAKATNWCSVKIWSTEITKTIIKESIKEDKEKELGIQSIFDFMEEKNDLYKQVFLETGVKKKQKQSYRIEKQGKSNLEMQKSWIELK